MIETVDTHRVEIRQENGTQVYVDGLRLKRVREVSFHQSTEEAPTIKVSVYGAPTMKMDAFVEIESGADKYLEWMDKKIEESEGDVRYALMECRGEYRRLLGV